MSIRDVLIAARATITDPARWTQGTWARRSPHGSICNPRALDATCWCLGGAIVKNVPPEVRPGTEGSAGYIFQKLEPLATELIGAESEARMPEGSRRIVYVNDQLGHDAALRLLDMAIEREPA